MTATDERLEPIPHPLADRIRDGFVQVESRAPVQFLDGARADLLVRAGAAGQRVALVTDELSALTEPLVQALQDAGGAWVVRAVDGTLRDGLTGRRLESIAQSIDGGRITDADDIAVAYLRPEARTQVELVITSSVRHRAEIDTLLGAPAELASRQFHGEPPRAWDLLEPIDNAWDRDALTETARERMPADTRFTVRGRAGSGFIATVQVARTGKGLEETTRSYSLLGEPGSVGARTGVGAVAGALAAISDAGMPLIALAMARPARVDQLRHPVLLPPPLPIALLIGPPGVRALDLDVENAVERWGAVVVGRPRIPGLLFELGTVEEPGIDRLAQLLSWFDPARLAESLGLNETLSSALDSAQAGGADGRQS